MNECAGQLDQSFVERVVGPTLLRQPQFLQHFMGLEKMPAIETLEIRQVMRIQLPPPKWLDQL